MTLLAYLSFLTLMFIPYMTFAVGLQVSPTTLNLLENNSTELIYVSNTGSDLLRGQVRIYRWEQKAGHDTLVTTKDIQVSPPIMEIAPGETQLVRLVQKIPKSTIEQAFRVIVDELPSEKQVASPKGVQFLMQYSIPIFISPSLPENIRDHLDKSQFLIEKDKENYFFVINNSQNIHLKISDLRYSTETGKETVIKSGLVGYVLAGQSAKWKIKKPDFTGKFQAAINDNPTRQILLSYPY